MGGQINTIHLICPALHGSLAPPPFSWSCCPCDKFGTLEVNQAGKLYRSLIDLARGLTYFDDVELTQGGDEDQACLEYMNF